MLKSYKDLIVWQRSIELVTAVYSLTQTFPRNEQYGLVSQMNRASVSIPSNIAEGYRRKGLGEYLRFLNIAEASLAELETQIIIAKNLFPERDYRKVDSHLIEIEKMMFVLIKKLKKLDS